MIHVFCHTIEFLFLSKCDAFGLIIYLDIFWFTGHLSGVKVLHGLDKVVEGGAVILTLKDQSVLADGDVNNG